MKKKILSVFLIICFAAGIHSAAYAISGRGTQENPFRICTEAELVLLSDFPDCYFELENDIELTETWIPVESFSGTLDGKNHSITIKSYKSVTNTGFISTLNGTVKNLTLNAYNTKLTSSNDSPNCMGLIAAICAGTISNCRITGNITCSSTYNTPLKFGGICGMVESKGKINNSINSSAVIIKPYKDLYYNTYVYYGGIAYEVYGSVTNCMSLEQSISSDNLIAYYSGIAYTNSGTITNCYSAGGKDLKVASKYGISRGGTMTNCYYDKNVFGYEKTETTYGIPKSTLAMKMTATYEGWDFDTTWAIDENEENPINNGYPYLRAFYERNTHPATASTISAVNGNLVIDCKIKDVSDTHTVHIALYDSNNTLCAYYIIPNDRKLKDVFVVTADNGRADNIKIFTWNSLNMIEPVASSESIKIIR